MNWKRHVAEYWTFYLIMLGTATTYVGVHFIVNAIFRRCA